jgi:hypothetical protein
MSSVINQRHLSGRWREVFDVHAPTTNPNRRPRYSTNDRISGKGRCPDWFAPRIWEDDGGRVLGQECKSAA